MDSHDESSLKYESEATPLLEENYRIGKKDYQYMRTSELPLSFTQELYKTEANRKSVPASAAGSQIINLRKSLFDGTAVRGKEGMRRAGLYRAGW